MKQSQAIKERIIEASELPKDVTMGLPVLTLTGQLELQIENYIGIIEYSEGIIRIHTKSGQLKILGKHLFIEYYSNDDMKIKGQIQSITYH